MTTVDVLLDDAGVTRLVAAPERGEVLADMLADSGDHVVPLATLRPDAAAGPLEATGMRLGVSARLAAIDPLPSLSTMLKWEGPFFWGACEAELVRGGAGRAPGSPWSRHRR